MARKNPRLLSVAPVIDNRPRCPVRYLRIQDDPRFQSIFVDLDPSPHPWAAHLPPQWKVQVSFEGHLFWLRSISPSAERGWYFGEITTDIPRDGANLRIAKCIGFQRRHVFCASAPFEDA